MVEKVTPIRAKEDRQKALEEAADTKRASEMADMLQASVDSVRRGEVVGFVYVGRKKVVEKEPHRDVFEYIIADAMDIGLIGELHVIITRLSALYDKWTDRDTTVEQRIPSDDDEEI